MKTWLALFSFASLVAGPTTAGAVAVTWEARGLVEFSDLGPVFFATFMPELTGTQSGDSLILRITFDTDAVLISQTNLPAGGTTFSYDAASLLLALAVPGRGTHVFAIDDSIPPATIPSLIGIIDDQVIGDLVRDGVQFQHNYFLPESEQPLQFQVLAAFFSTDTSIISGGILPLAPDPRLSVGIERLISIVAPGSGSLSGTFSSLIRVPVIIAEPGSLALLGLGLVGLFVAQRRTIGDAG